MTFSQVQGCGVGVGSRSRGVVRFWVDSEPDLFFSFDGVGAGVVFLVLLESKSGVGVVFLDVQESDLGVGVVFADV